MFVDISLDILQTDTYRRLARDDKEEGFGIGYFFFSLCSLILIPFFLCMGFAIEIINMTQTVNMKAYKKFGCYFSAFLFSYLFYYLLFPLICPLILSVKSLWKGKEETHFELPTWFLRRWWWYEGNVVRLEVRVRTFEAEKQLHKDSLQYRCQLLWLLFVSPVTFHTRPYSFKNTSHETEMIAVELELEKFRLLECLGEAVPQFIIANFFYYRHTAWVFGNDYILFGLPVTHISILFSSVSITYGIITGLKLFCDSTGSDKEIQTDEVDKLELGIQTDKIDTRSLGVQFKIKTSKKEVQTQVDKIEMAAQTEVAPLPINAMSVQTDGVVVHDIIGESCS